MNFEPRNGKVRRVLTLTDPVIWRSNDGVIEVALADVTGLSASRHGYPNAWLFVSLGLAMTAIALDLSVWFRVGALWATLPIFWCANSRSTPATVTAYTGESSWAVKGPTVIFGAEQGIRRSDFQSANASFSEVFGDAWHLLGHPDRNMPMRPQRATVLRLLF